MIQNIKNNIYFFVFLISSLICFTLLWIFFGLGISFGVFFIYQGLFIIIPYSEVSMEKRLKISIIITGIVVGPLYTIIFTLLCLDYIFEYKITLFNYIMGFLDNQELIKVAFFIYSMALIINIVYLIVLLLVQKRFQQSTVNNNMIYISNLQSNIDNRNNQNIYSANQINDVQSMNNQQYNHINNFNNLIQFSNQQSNINQISININDAQNQFRQLQQQPNQEINFSQSEEDEDYYNIIDRQLFLRIDVDEEREDAVKTVCSRDAQSKDEGKECAICYEEFDKIKSVNDKRLISLICNHTFHATCIRNSIQSIGWKCPYCRTKISYKISKCKQQNIRSNMILEIGPNVIFYRDSHIILF